MAIFIDGPGIAAAGVAWTVIPSVPAEFPLDGLVSYLAVQGHELNAEGRVGSLAQWVGGDGLVAAVDVNGPTVESVGGVDMLRTTIAGSERLVAPPAPGGGSWSYGAAQGFSLAFPLRMVDLAAASQGLVTIGNFRVRYQNTGALQTQKPYAGGTQSFAPAFDFSALCIVGVTYDVAANRFRVYRNGAQVAEQVSANWGTISTTSVDVYGQTFNPGNPSEANFGDLVRYNRELTAPEMASLSSFLLDRFTAE